MSARTKLRGAPEGAGRPHADEGQQLIGWKLLVCFAVGAILWLGVIQLVTVGVPESGIAARILAALRLAMIVAVSVSLVLAGLAGLNGALRRRSDSPTARPRSGPGIRGMSGPRG